MMNRLWTTTSAQSAEQSQYKRVDTKKRGNRPSFFFACSIMSFAGCDLQNAIFDPIDNPVLLVDPSAPPTAQFILQRLRLPFSFIWCSVDRFDQSIDLLEALLIGYVPFQIVRPRLFVLKLPHSSSASSSCSTPPPALRAAMLLRRKAMLLSE